MQNTVMLVDDEEMVLSAIRSFLELETPYRVLTFSSAQPALAALREEPVDVIIADFLMPEVDGITFLKASREVQPFASRVLLTGYADKENAIRAINEASLYYYLEKPWSNEHLKLVVRNGIERAALFSELEMRVNALEQAHHELHDIRKRLIQAFI